jgi:endonuclease/exonuclease/phosphatase family metal-dependent hydrolase
MSWNIGYVYGVGSEGTDYKPMTEEVHLTRLNQGLAVIKEGNADIVLLQEIDFDSARTHNLDQAMYLAKKAGYAYVAYAPCWQHNYIPFPYWPFKNHFGKMYSGGAILSRYPILKNDVTLFSKPDSNPWWYNLFYLYRFQQRAKIDIGSKEVWIANHHLEAFDKFNRMEQAEIALNKMLSLEKTGEFVLALGGDFNTTPTNAVQKDKFVGYYDDDYLDDNTFNLFQTHYPEAISPEDYVLNEKKYFTFASDKLDRRLDFLFFNKDSKVLDFNIVADETSDHLPIVVEISF